MWKMYVVPLAEALFHGLWPGAPNKPTDPLNTIILLHIMFTSRAFAY